MPTYPNWLAGNEVTAAQLAAGLPVTIVKPADESLASNVTLQNDDHLTLPVTAGATYVFDCYLNYEGGVQGSSDLKYQWSAPSLATLRYQLAGLSSGGVQLAGPTRIGSTIIAVGTNGAGVLMAATMTGTLVAGANAGPLLLTWAQNTSSGTATIVHAQSYLRLQRTA